MPPSSIGATPTAAAAVERVLAADVLVVSSPTYKGSYSGLLKAFLDRIGGGALAGAAAIPILLGGAPNHTMAVSVHFAPLLVELGAVVPGGLFVLESDVDAFPSFAAGWVAERRALLAGAVASTGPPSPLRRRRRRRQRRRRRLTPPAAEPRSGSRLRTGCDPRPRVKSRSRVPAGNSEAD